MGRAADVSHRHRDCFDRVIRTALHGWARTGGAPGVYAIYGTWPNSTNVDGGDTQFSASTAGDNFVFSLDQNSKGNQWYKLGEITWTSGPITLTQQPTGSNTFVSMRAAGLLFEYVPEPSTLGLLGAGLVALAMMKTRYR